MKRLLYLFALVSLCGCSDLLEKERVNAVKDYETFWTQPDQILSIRSEQSIPESYAFNSIHLTGGLKDKRESYSMYTFTFRFMKSPDDYIDVRHICFYDPDSVVLHDVKKERFHWLNSKIASKTYSFRGIDDNGTGSNKASQSAFSGSSEKLDKLR